MSNGDAQSAVRQDILEADARAVQATIYAQIIAPWMSFHYPPGTPMPEVQFDVKPPEDQAGFASIVATLAGAGYHADPAELSKRFGLNLTYEPPATPVAGGMAFSAEKTEDRLGDALTEWLQPLVDELDELVAGDLPEDEFKRRLAAVAAGKKLGSSGKFEKFLEERIYDGIAAGATR